MATKKPDIPATPLPTSSASLSNLNREDIERLIQVIDERGIEEFELEQGGTRIRIVANRPQPAANYFTSVGAHHAGPPIQHLGPPPAAPPPAPAGTVAATSSTPNASEDTNPNLKKVTSPMVGTFYRSPSPGSKSFVEVGDKVDQDTVLCIIEAMKLMNEIKAETRGVVKKILVENTQPVEYGQAMFLIDPN